MALTSTCRENGSIVISSGDRLTIESAADFQQLLRDALEAVQAVSLEFEPGVQIDITGLQLICSACKTAAARGANLLCQGTRPRALEDMIAAFGAQRHMACKQNMNSNCIWFGGIS